MKRSIVLIVALVGGVISLSLLSYDPAARAQQQNLLAADSGVVTPGPNQILRVTVVNRGTTATVVHFGKIEYVRAGCGGGLCKLEAAAQQTTQPVTLAPGEAASYDVAGGGTTHGVRGTAFYEDNKGELHAFQIIDSQTGAVVSTLIRTTCGSDGDVY